VEEAEEIARSALVASRDALDRVAGALLEQETLTLDEVERLARPPSVPRRNGARSADRAPAGASPAPRA